MNALGKNEQILTSGHIYDPEGRLVADVYQEKIYSLETDPLGQRLVNSDTTIFEWRFGQLVAGRAVMVGDQRLGAISVGLPTEPLQAKVTAVRNQGLTIALATAIIGGLLALLLSRSITGPLQKLVQATQRIAKGDLTQEIDVAKGNNELAMLGTAMERMRADLYELYMGLGQQVTERAQALQESEARFHHVISSISDHIYMSKLTKDGKHINQYVSPNVQPLTGYPWETIMADAGFWPAAIIHPDDQAIAADQLGRFKRGQNSTTEYRIIQADGNIIWVRDSGRVEKDHVSQSITIYGVVSDITKHKQVEETLALARDQALKASRLKSQLLAKVSHELRTPLNAILGFTEMLEFGIYGPLSDKQQETTSEIIDSAKYLTTLVNELLDQAQLDAGKLTLDVSAFAPADLIEYVQSTVEVLAQAKGLTVTADIAANVPATLCGDPARVQQILVNLVSNAIKFTRRGTVQVRLFCPNATHWALQVSDTGSGIPAEAQSSIFEPFQQVDGSMTREHQGTGLGLSIVKQLVALMDGQITVESQIGKGSAFTVILPLQPNYEETV